MSTGRYIKPGGIKPYPGDFIIYILRLSQYDIKDHNLLCNFTKIYNHLKTRFVVDYSECTIFNW